jgi:uncharacterized protein YkwD
MSEFDRTSMITLGDHHAPAAAGARPRGRALRLALGAAAAAVALTGVAACNPVNPTVPAVPSVPASSPTVSAQAAYEGRVLVLVNAERTKRGLRPLAMNTCADGYANRWASTMARTGTFAHQSITSMLSACGARRVGENIAYGNVSADQMMVMWMNSPGHRANLLNPAFTHIGIGAVKTSSGRWYGVQDFITK